MSLPRFVVLKSKYNDKYLCYKHEGELPVFVQNSGDEVLSPYAKLEVVRAKCGGGLIHLRCCYSNKYLARWTHQLSWIVAQADRPDENRSQWTCTLFKPVFDDSDPRTVRLLHIQLGCLACHSPWEFYPNCVLAGAPSDSKDHSTAFTFVDWESLPPKPMNIEIGSWGGCGGEPWSFEVGGGITKIFIQSGIAVDAVSFVGQTAHGTLQSSPHFGGSGGNKYEIVLEWPREYLTCISRTYSGVLVHVITSLEFKTNLGKRFGPYGEQNGIAFGLTMKRGAIVGFHDRSGILVDAIGIFIGHIDS